MSESSCLINLDSPEVEETREQPKSKMKSSERSTKKSGKRGRKPAKIDVKAKLERSRQSARECRARKKLRYQYLEELAASRERAIYSLRDELEHLRRWCSEIDKGNIPEPLVQYLEKRHATVSQYSRARQNSSSESMSP
jgi:hypothetical protein